MRTSYLLQPEAKQRLFAEIYPRLAEVMHSTMPRDEKLHFLCNLLRNDVPYYDWVGFYLVDPNAERMLLLGPYAGEPTDHTHIAFGQGICGQAAERLENFVIQDVNSQDNYLSCSIHVKAEIVLPILHGGRFIAELDIDSHVKDCFTPEDEAFLEKVCHLVAPYL